MQVEHEVVPVTPEPAAEREVVPDAPPAAGARCEDDVVQCRVVTDDRRRGRLDEIGQVRIGPGPTERPDDRRGEDHIADQAQPNEQDAHGGDYNA